MGKEPACNAGDPGLIPGLGRSPGEGNGKPLQDSCLGNPMNRGAWRAAVHGVTSVGHDLATKPPPPGRQLVSSENWSFTFWLLETSTVLVSVCGVGGYCRL